LSELAELNQKQLKTMSKIKLVGQIAMSIWLLHNQPTQTKPNTTMQTSFNKRPQIGMTFIHAGQSCVIVKVHKFGTIDIQSPSGKLFRVTGLSFI
jgi:hypothetical protein